ncbi:MAG: glycosyltransferase [Hyphomonadaceae bacterium]|jgi:cellulose synthase/poly-beta-1,6-N-acetylglucosamine synthase-like glycosyltransferase|nr:glycosyltransferase [Hyphomonadaceae bacterium]
MADRRSTDFLGGIPAGGVPIRDATPDSARVIAEGAARLAALDATAELALRLPQASARFTGGARLLAWLFLAVAGLMVVAAWTGGLAAGTMLIGAMVLLVGLVRLGLALAALSTIADTTGAACPPPADDAELPVYTILIALHREASVTRQLAGAISALDWPKDRLDVIFVLEDGDTETRMALIDASRALDCRILSLPPVGPTTKPKALQAAMRFARGSLVCVFDAEDLPDRGQLRAAQDAFLAGGARLGCVQAPLVTWNDRESWIARQFAIDYAIWFRLVLPGLARIGRFLPLGGTSNHFRTEALRAVGGWDPYNVTEDADLGLRLARHGWTIATITPPTREEAPPRLSSWVRQRSRWIQGHIITLAVHARSPGKLLSALGPGGMVGLLVALVIGPLAALVRLPLFAGLLVAAGRGTVDVSGLVIALAASLIEIILAVLAIARDGRWRLLTGFLWLPLYQMVQIIPAGLALHTVLTRPHYWQKTDHGSQARSHAPAADRT